MTHTPGPWLLEGHTIYALVPHYGWYEDGKVMMTNRFTAHVQRGHESTPDELDANARLIAAAPDMLAALKAMLTSLDPLGVDEGPKWKRARAAIAKAEGRNG